MDEKINMNVEDWLLKETWPFLKLRPITELQRSYQCGAGIASADRKMSGMEEINQKYILIKESSEIHGERSH